MFEHSEPSWRLVDPVVWQTPCSRWLTTAVDQAVREVLGAAPCSETPEPKGYFWGEGCFGCHLLLCKVICHWWYSFLLIGKLISCTICKSSKQTSVVCRILEVTCWQIQYPHTIISVVDTDPVPQSNYSHNIRWSIPSRSPATPPHRWMLGHIKKIQTKFRLLGWWHSSQETPQHSMDCVAS